MRIGRSARACLAMNSAAAAVTGGQSCGAGRVVDCRLGRLHQSAGSQTTAPYESLVWAPYSSLAPSPVREGTNSVARAQLYAVSLSACDTAIIPSGNAVVPQCLSKRFRRDGSPPLRSCFRLIISFSLQFKCESDSGKVTKEDCKRAQAEAQGFTAAAEAGCECR